MLFTLLLAAAPTALAADVDVDVDSANVATSIENVSYTSHSMGVLLGGLNGGTYVRERGSDGQGRHFATQYGAAIGINVDGNVVILPSIALGARKFSGQSNNSKTRFIGGYSAVEVELEPEWGTYLYLLTGAKASWGYRRDGAGMDIGLTLAWGQQVAGPWWDYSGLRGGIEMTWVWGA